MRAPVWPSTGDEVLIAPGQIFVRVAYRLLARQLDRGTQPDMPARQFLHQELPVRRNGALAGIPRREVIRRAQVKDARSV